VLDPLAGYLSLASQIHAAITNGSRNRLATLSSSFNFAPALADHRSVKQLVETLTGIWPGLWRLDRNIPAFKETTVLRLNARKARSVLGWKPHWGFAESVARTVDWYSAADSPSKALRITRQQIADFGAH
jgi:CDP-glucose 4,6-dehydratase